MIIFYWHTLKHFKNLFKVTFNFVNRLSNLWFNLQTSTRIVNWLTCHVNQFINKSKSYVNQLSILWIDAHCSALKYLFFIPIHNMVNRFTKPMNLIFFLQFWGSYDSYKVVNSYREHFSLCNLFHESYINFRIHFKIWRFIPRLCVKSV